MLPHAFLIPRASNCPPLRDTYPAMRLWSDIGPAGWGGSGRVIDGLDSGLLSLSWVITLDLRPTCEIDYVERYQALLGDMRVKVTPDGSCALRRSGQRN